MNEIPTLIHGIGLGIVSIFLTAVLFIYTTSKQQDWDKAVILEKVANVKDFIVYLSFLFLPPFLWGLNDRTNIVIIMLGMIGVWYLFSQLRNIFLWISDLEGTNDLPHLKQGYRQKLREQFLSESTDDNRAKIWSMTWGNNDSDPGTEARLLEIFFNQAVKMSKEGNWVRLRDYLQTYNANRTKREIKHWHNTRIAFGSLLEISFQEHGALNNHQQSSNHDYIYIGNLIDELIYFYISTSLKSGATFVVFDALKNHLLGKEVEYARYFVGRVHKVLFESITDSRDNYTIWNHYFPQEWKITENNLEQNVVAREMFRFYIEWLQTKIGSREDWDKQLDEVSRELLPELYPSWWAELISYFIRPFGDDRAKSLFDTKPNFGFISRSFSGVNISMEDLERQAAESMRNQQTETINFFSRHFKVNKDELVSSIATLNSIIPSDEKEELRKGKLIEIFNFLKNRLDEIS